MGIAFRMVVSVPVLNDKSSRNVIVLYVVSYRCVTELYPISYDASRLLVMINDSRNEGSSG